MASTPRWNVCIELSRRAELETGEFAVTANGLQFACCRHGDLHAPALVMIRGLGTQMVEWSDELLRLFVESGLQPVIFDNRDVGLSSKVSERYQLADMAADVVGILDALDIQKAHVFGISLGGMVAQLVAHLHGERVGCLFSVMSTSGARDLPEAGAEVRRRLSLTADGREAVIAQDADNRGAFGSPGYPESLAVRMAAATRAYDRCHYPQGVARQMAAAVSDGSRVARLNEIQAPTLVIHGADDPLLPVACGEDTAAHIPDAEFLVVPGMGHNIPDALAGVIAGPVVDFIRRYPL